VQEIGEEAMRLFALVITVAALTAGAASAQAWKPFTVPELGVTAEFPGQPVRSTGIYKSALVPNGAPSHIYQLKTDTAVLTLVVVDVLDRGAEGATILEEAAYLLTLTGSDTRMDNTARVSGGVRAIYGRLITVDLKHGPTPQADGVTYPTQGALNWLKEFAGVDMPIGGSSTSSLFFTRGRLYLVHGLNLPNAGARASNAMRFAQSLSWAFPDYLQPQGRGAGGN
jgi:hypothetical protein